MAVFLARIVMPRSRSRSFESMTRSATASLARKVPDWRSIASTSVVFPWSTWAIMAILRMFVLMDTDFLSSLQTLVRIVSRIAVRRAGSAENASCIQSTAFVEKKVRIGFFQPGPHVSKKRDMGTGLLQSSLHPVNQSHRNRELVLNPTRPKLRDRRIRRYPESQPRRPVQV